MQQIIDYIRQNAATSAPGAIDAQLRQAGYSQAHIHYAWSIASVAPVPGVVSDAAVIGGGPSGNVHALSNGHRGTVMVVALVLALVGAGTAYVNWSDDSAGSLATSLEAITPGNGSLPGGWDMTSDQVWSDSANGNTVMYVKTQLRGNSLARFVAYEAKLRRTVGTTSRGTITPSSFQGRSATLASWTRNTEISAQISQWYIAAGDGDVMIVTATVTADGADERDEVLDVAAQVPLPS